MSETRALTRQWQRKGTTASKAAQPGPRLGVRLYVQRLFNAQKLSRAPRLMAGGQARAKMARPKHGIKGGAAYAIPGSAWLSTSRLAATEEGGRQDGDYPVFLALCRHTISSLAQMTSGSGAVLDA